MARRAATCNTNHTTRVAGRTVPVLRAGTFKVFPIDPTKSAAAFAFGNYKGRGLLTQR